jgi:hypothetical protein
MLRLIAVAGFALSIATSAQGMSPAPLPQPDNMVTQIAAGCGAGTVYAWHGPPSARRAGPSAGACDGKPASAPRTSERTELASGLSRIGRQLRFQMTDVCTEGTSPVS